MCGIGGVYRFSGSPYPEDGERADRLSEAMRRRGPDAKGTWTSPDARVRLVHRRLSIIDLSPAGNQPLIDGESGCVLVFNGEIYNFRALRELLVGAGHRFRSASDSEVLLKGYLQWGEGLLPRLRGMFAFALWDPRKQALWLARDPYGIKPLYYAALRERLVFASQVKALRDSFDLDTRPDPAALVGLLLMGSVPEPYTVCRGIRALPAGHALWVTDRGVGEPSQYASVSQTWRAAAGQPEPLDAEPLVERVRKAVMDSVHAHQVADVPVGAFLSAGIDSGALVGLMAEGRTAPVRTMTLGFNRFCGTRLDEVELAEQVSMRYGANHHTQWVSDTEAAADLPRALADMDQPSVDGFNTWLVSKQAAALGLKVMVSGVGGDELFGGYDHFAEIPVWRRRLQAAARVPGLQMLLAGGLGIAGRLGLVHAKAEALSRLGSALEGLYLVKRGLFMPWELPALLDADLLREGVGALQPPRFLAADESVGRSLSDYAEIAALEATNYLRNQLLRDSDWASMAHSLELRTPLVDFQLLRELAPLLVARRPPGLAGKRMLAVAPTPPLPDSVIHRPKSGFFLPMGDWLAQTSLLNQWRRVPRLNSPRCHWSRRMAYALAMEALGD